MSLDIAAAKYALKKWHLVEGHKQLDYKNIEYAFRAGAMFERRSTQILLDAIEMVIKSNEHGAAYSEALLREFYKKYIEIRDGDK